MKPSKLVPVAIMAIAIGSIWTTTLLLNMSWYAKKVSSDVLMGIIILLALLTLFGGVILLLSKLE